MDILILQVFVSLSLVGLALLLYAITCRQRDFEHADRLSLLPLNEHIPEPEKAEKDDSV
jgi:hypothetical protein